MTQPIEFAVGQRWLSDTESELGLGVVVDVDERCVHILFPQSEETRVYAKASAPLSRVAFKAGDWFTDQEGNQWQIERVSSMMGVLRYHVHGQEKPLMETRLAANISLAKPLDRLLASRIETNEWYELRQEILRMQAALSNHPLRGLMGARVGIIAHQLYIAHEVGKRLAPRVLLADEVGLGKTIEAGLIIHQQLHTGRSERVLVLVPDSLQYQWLIEMRRRFNLNFAAFDLVRTAAIKEHSPEENPFLTEQQIICSVDLLLDHEDLLKQALAAGFDLLVVDEAHHLHWDETQGGNDKYNMVAQFAAQTAGVLLLTATPEQLGVDSHFARLRLLDPQRFNHLDDFIDSEADFAQTAQIAEILMGNTPLTDKQLTILEQLLGHEVVDEPPARQRALNELLDRHGTGRVLFRNTRDSVKGFYGRRCRAYPLPCPESWQNSYQTQGKLREQLWPEENQPNGEWLTDNPKVPWLIELLKNELKFDKVLLIARSGATIESLEAVLRLHAGIKTAVFTEQMSLLERDQAAAYFADGLGAQILLCSEIGSEGRNFQFAHHLVLFDLPANPDTLEQRIGRLDRIGQTDPIELHVPFVTQTAQARLFMWYDQALNMFNAISPAAQNIQESYITELKPCLEGTVNSDTLNQLIAQANQHREQLEDQLQQGRDRLLEYNSCRPRVAGRIVDAMQDYDANHGLQSFVTRFLSAVNVDYSEQSNGTVIVQPTDDIHVDNLPLHEDGMTLTFNRQQALVREDIEFVSHEHPLMKAIYELVQSSPFGNTNVALLKTNAMPEASLLIEVTFRATVIAPRLLNLPASVPKQLLRVLMSEKGQDLSSRISADMILPHIGRLDKNRARQVLKLRHTVIEHRYHEAVAIANAQLGDIAAQAKENFSKRWQREIDRLVHLQAHNPSIRDAEIQHLQDLQNQGLHLLDQLALVPDAIRVLVAVKP